MTGTGIGMGGAVLFTVAAASASPEGKRKYCGISLVLLALFGAALTALIFLVSPPVLRIFGAEGETLALAEEYMRFIALGSLFQVLGTGLTPFIRNMGGTVTAMSAILAGFVTNIILDYLFVWVLPWGMTGAAVATVIGQAATFCVCL